MEQYICKCCGANLGKAKNGVITCEYCGSTFKCEEVGMVDEDITSHQVLQLLLESEEYRKTNKIVLEIQVLVKALEMDKNSELIWTKLGRAYRSINLLDKAADCYEKALAINDEFGTAYTNLGAIAVLQKDYIKACQYYEKGIAYLNEVEADYPVALANYALAVGLGGDKRKAKKLLKDAVKRGYKNGKFVKKGLGIIF